ncbi:MAG: hypothetical protein MI754_00860 [Chromatiales bacterium]|nr:hypothetical protein [Chromatiales bacterium]
MQIQALAEQVQRNCHISDARHGSDYGLCTYLMKMREYYRWERGLAFTDVLDKDQVGNWLTEREQLWHSLDEAEFSDLQIGETAYDPFAVEEINQALNPWGYVYSGGLGSSGRPHFFLAELHEESLRNEGVLVAGRELARDLASPPAMNQGKLIFVRKESLRRMLWEKLESWRWSRADNALGRAFACYDFEHNLERALDQITMDELSLVLLHERGEKQVGELFGDAWNEMVLDLVFTPAELIVRAIRDHLADCLVTLPALHEMGRDSSVHFYIGNLTGMRKSIYPEMLDHYERWRERGDFSVFTQAAEVGRGRWQTLAEQVLALHKQQGSGAAQAIKALFDATEPAADPVCQRNG